MKENFFYSGFFTSFHIWNVLYKIAEKGSSYPTHKHPLFEILYCETGRMSEWVNGVEYPLESGDFILINSNDLHYLETHEESRFFNFHFDVEPREVHSLFHALRKPIASVQQSPDIRREIHGWMQRLISLFRSEEELAFTQKMILQSNMMQFLAFILEKIVIPDTAMNAPTSLSRYQIATEVAYVLETSGGTEQVLLSELSARLHVHRNYMTKCFKQVYGVSPKHYLMKVKVEKAKKLLQETTLSIEAIAEALAFSSPAYFSTFFRSHVGVTPFRYRSGEASAKL
ncbi:AraC family transcriptional regulator [Paenibacillus sp. GD4]|jgi:YesN/AraC family two-component response regulator|uniref:helix-turn-helix domain-containing protein n=1 Tax=Paenibacillus sp. GD4 TaxID=3068890 RepID=UPI0027964DF2|nr:AraC family transcriptional regulator [Paenibacillus sp. GD4]MDQ1912698.1 AraC family transcriptional regulator [Paenibacillus sp. GD4]